MKNQVDAFKAAQLFVPHKVIQIRPDANAIDSLKAFPFLNFPSIIAGLKSELSDYLARAAGMSSEVDAIQWWQQESRDLPTWGASFCKVLLIQPSSAAAERVFSLLSNSFGHHQDLALQDYIESSLMLQYNREKD